MISDNTNCFFGIRVNSFVKVDNLVKHESITHIQAKMDSSGSIVSVICISSVVNLIISESFASSSENLYENRSLSFAWSTNILIS